MTSEQAGGRESARQPASPAAPRLELRHVSKSFGGVHVLEDIDFRLGAAEVVGLLGDNGAGKSTLIKIITGVHQPDQGEILFGGERVEGLTVQRARALGVETVFQERALADDLSLWRNIFMGRADHRPLRVPAGRRDAARDGGAHGRVDGLHLGGADAGHERPWALRRRAPGAGHRARPALPGRHHHPRRADDGPVPEGDREAARLRRRHPGRRQVGDLHRPQHLPRVLGGGPDRRPGPRPRGRRVPDLALFARGAHGHHARGRLDRHLHGGRTLSPWRAPPSEAAGGLA